jgi:hypothetical protein
MERNTNQTASRWIIAQLDSLSNNSETHLGFGDVKVTKVYLADLLVKALEKEKEQIIASYVEGIQEAEIVLKGMEQKHAEWHYRDTYGE